MTGTRRTGHLAVLGLVTALAALGGPAIAEPLPASSAPPCMRPSGENGANMAAYSSRARDNGNTTQVVPGGEVTTDFQPLTVSCPGATYTFTVSSADGSALGWSTKATSPADARTSVSPDGRTATVTFTGDGAVQRFELVGSTSASYDNHNTCVGLSMTTSYAGTSYVWSSATGRVCSEGTGAGSFYG